MRGVFVIFAVVVAAYGNASASVDEPSIYGMQKLKLSCDTEEKVKLVLKYENEPGFDWLRLVRDLSVPVEVLVSADRLSEFKQYLMDSGIEFEVTIEDVSKLIEKEFAQQALARSQRSGNKGLTLKYFPRYDEIVSYLKSIAEQYSDRVEFFSIGKSFEGREIVGAKFSSGGDDKPALLIDAGIHAREWIAPTTALYAIKQLAENVSNSYLYDDIDIYIIPSLNPDGYEYTHSSPANRMWRKTRSTNPSSECRGADANRNFGYKWMTGGASSNPCDYQTYAGSKPFSENETAALRDFVLAKKGLFKVYLTIHSYGSYFLHPWGYTEDLPENEPTLRCVAEKAVAALTKVYGTKYTIGSSTQVLYAAAGGSDDWVQAEGGAELAYTIELPGYSFIASSRQIGPVGRETFEAIKVAAQHVANNIC